MPPALSDDEMSDANGVGAITTPPPSKRGKKIGSYADVSDNSDDNSNGSSNSGKARKRDNGRVKNGTRTNGSASAASRKEVKEEDNDEDNEDDDDEEAEDEEAEDEENASEILSEYITKIGGRPKLFEKPAKGKKRGRRPASTTPTNASKRPRKSEDHPANRESLAEEQKVFKAPAGSWEDEVSGVEMFRSDDGELRVFLTWKNGSRSQHAAQQAYTRCPQKILHFYESRISFRTPTG
ncbi:hypothetical protein SEUCBS140593_005102 [Sporothrix eucalyptigena]|uniref:Chromo shadow domain-containing protein n=1 Tax=Sporothrix eucalyptigena TaxID=1812306 RepID=A0ABP0BU63_9PEZI